MSSSTAGSGGQGGRAPQGPCDHLAQNGKLTELALFSKTFAYPARPTLVPLGGGKLAIVRTHIAWGMGAVGTDATTATWTQEWPPADSATVTMASRAGYVAAPYPRAPNGISLLGPRKNGSPGLAFGVADAIFGDWTEQDVTDAAASDATFLISDGVNALFVGMAVGSGDGMYPAVPHIGWVSKVDTATYSGPIDLGCPTLYFQAAAAPVPGGFLLARAEACADPPTLSLTRFDGTTAAPGDRISYDHYQPVDLVARPGGAWLVAGNLPDGGLGLSQVDALGKIELGPLSLPAVGDVAADALDGGLVLASSPTTSDVLTLGVVDAMGTPIGSASVLVGAVQKQFQVAVDPATRQVLVAVIWDTSGANSPPETHLEVARFACE